MALIQKPSNAMYRIGEDNYRGIVSVLTALRDSDELQANLLSQIKKIDYQKLKGIKPE